MGVWCCKGCASKGARNSQACIKIVRAVSGFRCLLGCLCFIIAAKPDQKPNTRPEIDACFATGHNVATCVPEWVRWVDRGTSAHSVWASGPKQTAQHLSGVEGGSHGSLPTPFKLCSVVFMKSSLSDRS